MGATFGDALALDQFNAALKGRTEAAREIREAMEGKAGQRTEKPEKREVIFTVVYDRTPPKRGPDDPPLGPAQEPNQ